jgi:transcription antitermination factor NusG
MGYSHAFYAPFQIGDNVSVIEGPHIDKTGTVTRLEHEDAFFAEDTTYAITFEGETEECTYPFNYWQLSLQEDSI